MSRLHQLFEYLFVNADSALVLDSGTTGVFQQEGVPALPVFRTPLSSGQILLLFTDVVPRTLSTQLLSGVPVEFPFECPQGVVQVHMTLNGDDLRVTARAVKKAPPTLVPIFRSQSSQLGPPPPDLAPPSPVPSRAPGAAPSSLRALLEELVARGASHLHLSSGGPALLRVDRHLVPVQSASFSEAALVEELAGLAPEAVRELVAQHARLDFTHVGERGVFHVAAQRDRGGLSVVVRHLPRSVPAVASLGLPRELVAAMTGGGLWVLAGPSGHGVTTSLASVVQALVTQRPLSVRCLEAPIEYVLSPGAGPLCQLEVGAHVASFAEGLRDARRDDVDVVMVSELDDAEVLAEALALAERGVLVIGTLHAHGAAAAARKLLRLTEGDGAARWRLGQVFRGVFAQALCRNRAGGKTLAWELLPGVPQVHDALAAGEEGLFAALRSKTLEQGLGELVAAGVVERDEALAVAFDRSALEASPAAGRSAA